jgi:hypothetical protein
VRGVRFRDIIDKYGAVDFQDALADFVVLHNFPGLSTMVARHRADNTLIPFSTVSVFHKMRFIETTLHQTQETCTVDAAYARPEQRDKSGNVIPARFDTVLVCNGSNGEF